MSKKSQVYIFALVYFCSVFVSLICGIYFGRKWGINRDIPFVGKGEYSIGIYEADSLFQFRPAEGIKNPVLTADDVNDIPAHFVADPFMIERLGRWYMFFEVLNIKTKQGDIALASSDDGLHWKYERVVIDEPFHMSYPYVFEWNDEYYMIPETGKSNEVRLYRSTTFPFEWTLDHILFEGNFADPSLLYYKSMWWLFTEKEQGFLRLYYSDDLWGDWTEHPMSPVVKNNSNIARPGGRIIIDGDEIIRFTQDGDPNYGNQVRMFRIKNLTLINYEEYEDSNSPIFGASGSGWNADKMHHIDPHKIGKNKWISCVDGFSNRYLFGWKY